MLHVIDHTTLPQERSEGWQRLTVADRRLGLNGFEVWVEKIAPRAQASLRNAQRADQAIMVVGGRGELIVGGSAQRFMAPCRLFAPARRECSILNTGEEPVQLIIAFLTTP